MPKPWELAQQQQQESAPKGIQLLKAQQAKPTKSQEFAQDFSSFAKRTSSFFDPIAQQRAQEFGRSEAGQQIGGALSKGLTTLGQVADYVAAAPLRAFQYRMMQGLDSQEPLLSTIPQAIGAGINQYVRSPFSESTAPTPRQVAELGTQSQKSLSDIIPGAYSATGEGWRLKKGSYTDPTMQDINAAVVSLTDPSILVGGELTAIPKAGVKSGFKAGVGAGKAALGEKRVERVKAALSPWQERLSGVTNAITGKNVKPADDLDRYVNLAKEIGLKPDELPATVWAGTRSDAAKIERTIAEGASPYSQELTNKYVKAHEKLKTGIDKHIEKVAGVKPEKVADISDEVNQSILSGIDRQKKSIETTYASAIKDGDIWIRPEDKAEMLRQLSGIRSKAKAYIETGDEAQKARGKSILSELDKIEKLGDSYRKTYQKMQQIGEAAYDGVDIFSQPEKRKMYEVMSATLYKSIDDPRLKKLIEEDNKKWTGLLSKEERVKRHIGNKNLSSEQALRKLFETGNKDDIEALKAFVDEGQLKRIKGAYLAEITRPIEQSAETGGIAGYKSTLNKLNNPKKYGVLSVMFNESDLDPLKKYMDFGERLGAPIMSTSGTGPANQINKAIDEALDLQPKLTFAQGMQRKNLVKARQEMEEQLSRKAPKKPGAASGIMSFYNRPTTRVPVQQTARQYTANREER